MDDPRLIEWLELAERALAAPAEERGEVLSKVAERRAELQGSLEQTPPAEPAAADLARRLSEAEEALGQLAQTLRDDLQTRVAELRQVRNAAQGYRPARSNTPAFISKSV